MTRPASPPVSRTGPAALRARTPWVRPAPFSAATYPPIPVRRGHADAFGAFGVAFGGYALASLLACARLIIGLLYPGWASGWNIPAVSVATGSWWLARLLWDGGRRARAGVAILIAIGVASVLQIRSFWLPDAIWDLVYIPVCAGLALWLAARRGVSPRRLGLAPRWAANTRGRVQAALMVVAAFAAMSASSYAAALVQFLCSWLPVGQPHQVTMHGWDLLMRILASGTIEELLLVAALVTALQAAGRPVWQIYAIGLGMRLSFHLYYGATAPASLIFAAVHLWLYRRTRRLTPLIVAHVGYDAFACYTGLPGAVVISWLGFATFAVVIVSVPATLVKRLLPRRRGTPNGVSDQPVTGDRHGAIL